MTMSMGRARIRMAKKRRISDGSRPTNPPRPRGSAKYKTRNRSPHRKPKKHNPPHPKQQAMTLEDPTTYHPITILPLLDPNWTADTDHEVPQRTEFDTRTRPGYRRPDKVTPASRRPLYRQLHAPRYPRPSCSNLPILPSVKRSLYCERPGLYDQPEHSNTTCLERTQGQHSIETATIVTPASHNVVSSLTTLTKRRYRHLGRCTGCYTLHCLRIFSAFHRHYDSIFRITHTFTFLSPARARRMRRSTGVTCFISSEVHVYTHDLVSFPCYLSTHGVLVVICTGYPTVSVVSLAMMTSFERYL